MVHVDLAMAAAAIGNMARSHGLNWDDATAFWRIIGNIKLELSGETRSGAKASVYGRTITFYRRPNGTENFLPLMDLFQHELGHVFNAIAGMGDRDGAGSINLTFGHPDTLDGMGSPDEKLVPADKNAIVLYDQSLEPMKPLSALLGVYEGDKLLRRVNLNMDRVPLLRQSWDGGKNEYTADAFLNMVFDEISGGRIGFTDDAAGDKWEDLNDTSVRTWIRNAIVLNALSDNRNIPFFLAHDRIQGFVGMARVRDRYDEAIVRNATSTAGGSSTVVGTLTAGDEVAVLGEIVLGEEATPRKWTSVIWNGTQRWMASFLLDLPENVPPPSDQFLDFDGGFSRAKDWQFYFDLLRYLIHGVGNDS